MLHDCNADQDATAQQSAQAADVLSGRATARCFNIRTRGRTDIQQLAGFTQR